jgi:hypothetical protein
VDHPGSPRCRLKAQKSVRRSFYNES